MKFLLILLLLINTIGDQLSIVNNIYLDKNEIKSRVQPPLQNIITQFKKVRDSKNDQDFAVFVWHDIHLIDLEAFTPTFYNFTKPRQHHLIIIGARAPPKYS